MFYNSHNQIFAAYSDDGFTWQKLGNIGVSGADIDATLLTDGSYRIYFGDDVNANLVWELKILFNTT